MEVEGTIVDAGSSWLPFLQVLNCYVGVGPLRLLGVEVELRESRVIQAQELLSIIRSSDHQIEFIN